VASGCRPGAWSGRRGPYARPVTHYEVLGVRATAPPNVIRLAYLDLARRHHPDFHTNDDAAARERAEREMRRINEAWFVLRDPEQRRRYDVALRRAAGEEGGAAASPGSGAGGGWVPGSGTANPEFVPVDDAEEFATEEERQAWLDSLDDQPFGRARPVPRWQQVLPVGLFGASLACLCLGLVVGLAPLAGLGVALLVLSGLAFVLTPMLTVMRSYEREPD
jgi:hypothetical protein